MLTMELTDAQEAVMDAEHIEERNGNSQYLRAAVERAEYELRSAKEAADVASDMLNTPQVVTAFSLAKRVQKLAAGIEETLKGVLKGRETPRDAGGKTQNKKVVLEGENGAKVELRPKVTVKFNAQEAERILKSKDLYNDAVDRTTVITDPKALYAKMKEAAQTLMAAGHMDLAFDLGVTLKQATEERVTLSEDRIMELVKAEKLAAEEVADLYDTTVDHSAYDITK